MDFSTFKKKLEEADILLAALRANISRRTSEGIKRDIQAIIDRIVAAAAAQADGGEIVRELLESIPKAEGYDLRFENVLGAYHYMRRTRA